MADKKKNPSRSQSSRLAESKTHSEEKEQSKAVKAVARERDERKTQESKTVRRETKGPSSKGPAPWQVRLRGNRTVRFVLDAYYELRHKVTWPSFTEARNMTIVVILLSAAVAALLGAADFGLYQLFLLISRIGGQ